MAKAANVAASSGVHKCILSHNDHSFRDNDLSDGCVFQMSCERNWAGDWADDGMKWRAREKERGGENQEV